MLSKFVGVNQRDWDIRIPYLAHAYRTSVHSATLESPFYLMHLQDPILPVQAVLNYVPSPYVDTADDYKLCVLDNWRQARELIRAHLAIDQSSYKSRYDKKAYLPYYRQGDLVLLHNPCVKVGHFYNSGLVSTILWNRPKALSS